MTDGRIVVLMRRQRVRWLKINDLLITWPARKHLITLLQRGYLASTSLNDRSQSRHTCFWMKC